MTDETYYIEGTGVEGEEANNRRGNVCCFKLMDSRKAVILVDTINIFAIILSVLFNAVIYHERSFGGVFAGLLGMLLSVIGLFGAINFDLRASGIATIGFCLCFAMDFIGLHFIGVIVDSLLIYPHALFSYEVHRGVMTRETYKNEEYLMPGLPKLPDMNN